MLPVTLILLNYKRQFNIPRIVADARAAGAQAVWCWDNGGGIDPSLFDRYHRASENMGCAPRWEMACEAMTDFVCVLDDDLTLRPDALSRCIERSDGLDVIGAFGRRLNPSRPYGKCPIIKDGACDIVLGRFVFMPFDQAHCVGRNPEKFEDDIYASSRFTSRKLILPKLTRELNAGAKRYAVCHREGHYQAREAARRRYFNK